MGTRKPMSQFKDDVNIGDLVMIFASESRDNNPPATSNPTGNGHNKFVGWISGRPGALYLDQEYDSFWPNRIGPINGPDLTITMNDYRHTHKFAYRLKEYEVLRRA